MAVAAAPAGYGEVICLGQNGIAYQIRQDNTGAWTAAGAVLFIPGGVPIVAVAAAPAGYGEVICLGQNGAPYTAWQDNTGVWIVEPVPSIPLHATGLVTGAGSTLQAIFL